jgi:hypothetical protein
MITKVYFGMSAKRTSSLTVTPSTPVVHGNKRKWAEFDNTNKTLKAKRMKIIPSQPLGLELYGKRTARLTCARLTTAIATRDNRDLREKNIIEEVKAKLKKATSQLMQTKLGPSTYSQYYGKCRTQETITKLSQAFTKLTYRTALENKIINNMQPKLTYTRESVYGANYRRRVIKSNRSALSLRAMDAAAFNAIPATELSAPVITAYPFRSIPLKLILPDGA